VKNIILQSSDIITYREKARDSLRLADIRALETVAMALFSSSGKSLSISEFRDTVKSMNNNKLISDPTDGTKNCVYNNKQS
jgi:hypothetical protein